MFPILTEAMAIPEPSQIRVGNRIATATEGAAEVEA
jgi:hypothetical protein